MVRDVTDRRPRWALLVWRHTCNARRVLRDPTVLVGELGGQFRAGGLVDLADHHCGAFGGEAVRHRAAEALPGAGDQDGLPRVAVHTFLPHGCSERRARKRRISSGMSWPAQWRSN
jgi:hypothetical protein